MDTQQKHYHPYHLPPSCDSTSDDVKPDDSAAYCVDRIYLDQRSTFAFDKIPSQPDKETYEFMEEYPTGKHPNAPHPLDICTIFDEDEQIRLGRPTRNSYEFHADWRQVLPVMTIIFACRKITTYRPIFATIYSNFVSGDYHDTITVKEVWAFISLLLDIVLEAVSAKLLSGESSTRSASQLAEQTLVGIGLGVKPFLDHYAGICRSAMFSRLIGRLNTMNIAVCQFSTMEEIVSDEGGLYLFYLVRAFISQALAAIVGQTDLDLVTVFNHYDICTLRFPNALECHMLPWTDLRDIAFDPLISALFLAGTVEKTLGSLDLPDYVIVAPARNRLYCCTGVRKLTDGLFNSITSDVVIHGYFKKHNHMFLTAEIFGFASTVIMFNLHALRTGCLAGRPHPIIDPAFSIRGADGEFTKIFMTVWGVHADTLRSFGKFNTPGLPGVDYPFPTAPGTLTPEVSHTPSSMIRRQRSMADFVSVPFMYFNREKSSPGADPLTPSASGSSAGLSLPFSAATRSPLASPAPPSAGYARGPFCSVKSALQDFVGASRLTVDSTFDDGSSRFPLLHVVARQRAQKLAQMAAASGAAT